MNENDIDSIFTKVYHSLCLTNSSITRCNYGDALFYNKEAMDALIKILEQNGKTLEEPKDCELPF